MREGERGEEEMGYGGGEKGNEVGRGERWGRGEERVKEREDKEGRWRRWRRRKGEEKGRREGEKERREE